MALMMPPMPNVQHSTQLQSSAGSGLDPESRMAAFVAGADPVQLGPRMAA